MVQGMSYWTYSDLFEEPGPPSAPFQGGFGLMNPQGIRKPAWFAYKYLNAIRGSAVPTADPHAFASTDRGRVSLLLWDWHQPDQKMSNRPFYTRLQPSGPAGSAHVRFAGLAPGRYRLRTYRTGYRHNDAYSAYIDMNMPAALTSAQLSELQRLTQDKPEQDRIVRIGAKGVTELVVPLHTNDVVLVGLDRVANR
jgi:xylan 1,4-beta-xylosidase